LDKESKATNIHSHKDFSIIATTFVKANSTLSSSAAVERLFGVTDMILTPRRCKMSDILFDKMVFLKCRSACQPSFWTAKNIVFGRPRRSVL